MLGFLIYMLYFNIFAIKLLSLELTWKYAVSVFL